MELNSLVSPSTVELKGFLANMYLSPFCMLWIATLFSHLVYHPKHKSFNGSEMAQSLIEVLRSCLSESRLLKLRFIMADGAPVNSVARQEIETTMLGIRDSLVSAEDEFYSRLSSIGSTDRENIVIGVTKHCPRVELLPCFGHLFHNMAKDAMQHYANLPIMKVRTYFSRIFYAGDRVGAKKG